MAFYSPNWVRKLIKEESQYIVDYVSKKDKNGKYVNDFRDYVDAALPFVLWLDLSLIKERILDKSRAQILEVVKQTKIYSEENEQAGVDNIVNMLLDAYRSLINSYIDNPRYRQISSNELQDMLNRLTGAEVGKVKTTIKELFSKTLVVSTVSKRNKSVMLIFPKFTTLTVGTDLKALINFDLLGLGDPSYIDTPARIVKDAMLGKESNFFTKLQNIGHVEVDVVSTTSREIKRGQSSPRLLQALISVPNTLSATTALQKSFSRETGQHNTRVVVRKKFASSKMIFEMLVESGMSVGIPETQADNLEKAALERAFTVGSGLSAQIRKNPEIVLDLETSKSMKQYVLDQLALVIEGKNKSNYSSSAEFTTSSKVSVPKITIKTPKPIGGSPAVNKPKLLVRKVVTESLISLQNLINGSLRERIVANMGKGSDTRILNYRTGRFADSVKLERMSQSREGMITAFYSYMKNPYATFSAGGRQENPKSRDPKLLISKSIREIAAKEVGNRLRAVNV